MVDPSAQRPVYRQVADILRAQVARRQAGDLLPAEKDLAWELRVGGGAVRDALRVLEDEGLIERRPGQRARVRATPATVPVELPPGAVVTVRRPSEAERVRLGLAGGELVVEVDDGGDVTLYGSDRVVLRVP